MLTLGLGFAGGGGASVFGDVAGGEVGAEDVGADVGDETEPGLELIPRDGLGLPLVEVERDALREGVREESEGLGWGLVTDGGRWMVVRDDVDGGFIEFRDDERDCVVCSRTG